MPSFNRECIFMDFIFSSKSKNLVRPAEQTDKSMTIEFFKKIEWSKRHQNVSIEKSSLIVAQVDLRLGVENFDSDQHSMSLRFGCLF